ncbi:MAG: hypothetical protein ACYC2Z_10230 [Candidatus Nanopelagicales bacterium]
MSTATSPAPGRQLRSRTATPLFVRAWERLDAPLTGRTVPGTVTIAAFAMLVGVVATVVSYQQDWILLFFDTRSHLTIARALTDSVNPGFYQLGTVWLPIPHLLLMPFMMVFPLWQTGLGGSMLGVIALGVSAAALWRVAYRVGFGRAARFVVVGAFVFNPTMLYLSTTALTEPVLIAALLASLAGLAGWITAMPAISPGALAVFAGVPVTLAVLSRYEGWAFVAVSCVFIVIASWRRWRSVSYTVTLLGSYLAVPAAGVVWWFSYNYIRFGDPLEFARGPYSAGAEAALRSSLGVLPQKGNLGLSLAIYHDAAINIVGIPLLVFALVGGGLFLYQRGFSTTALVVWLPAFWYPFIVLSLYTGQIIIVNDSALPASTLYNNRYAGGNGALVALLCGALVDIAVIWRPRFGRALGALVVATALGFTAWSFADGYNRMVILREGSSNTVQGNAEAAGKWVSENYEGGYVLLDAGSRGDAIVLGIDNDQIISVDNGPVFERALADPAAYVQWVFVNTDLVRTSVWKILKDDPAFLSRFALAHEEGSFQVYKNLGPSGSPL